ncbi:MAG: UbiA family prenyltransferase [Saprospiraceae bacterium]|nr:UbiA family prenyltransferase [Saprospiraceae bacterium]
MLPIFLFAWAIHSEPVMAIHFGTAFFLIHFFLYPASNAYNSYFDKDEKSIGGLKHPPKVSKELYTYALLFDFYAILGAILFLNWQVGIMFFIYGLASKAYSHPSIRLKKYPYISWLIAGFFQGYLHF